MSDIVQAVETATSAAVGLVKSASMVLGALASLGTAYYAVGGPIPATQSYVRGEIGSVVTMLTDSRLEILETRLTTIELNRNFLRAELTGLERLVDSADVAAKNMISRRKGQIEDTLDLLNRQEKEARDLIQELRRRSEKRLVGTMAS